MGDVEKIDEGLDVALIEHVGAHGLAGGDGDVVGSGLGGHVVVIICGFVCGCDFAGWVLKQVFGVGTFGFAVRESVVFVVGWEFDGLLHGFDFSVFVLSILFYVYADFHGCSFFPYLLCFVSCV